ncbi:MAG: hypothetical protein MJ211_01470 [Bacteroidales bacterium]|nr:hypothetical protein [Bacteroidales bacterium]
MNSIFDIKRFGYVLKRDFREVLFPLCLLVIISIICLVLYKFFYHDNSYIDMFINFATFVIYISTLTFPLNAFRNINNSTKRINFLILPTSNLEKFFARLVNYWLIPLIIVLIVFIIKFIIDLPENEEFSFVDFYNNYNTGIVASLCISTLIVFLGILFRKASILQITLILSSLLISIGFIAKGISHLDKKLVPECLVNVCKYIGNNIFLDNTNFLIFQISISAIISVLFLFLSYRQLLKCQVK